MFLLEFVRWLRGTVSFLITGAFPEKLITSCQRTGLPIWGIRREKDAISAETYAGYYRRLRPAARKNGLKIRIIKKNGLWVYRHRYRRRKGIAIGLAAVLLLFTLASMRVWRIEIEGCAPDFAEEIRYDLIERKIAVGTKKRDIDARTLQREMMLSDDRIAWIALNLVGTTLYVQVSERDAPPEQLDPSDRVANIVAQCDGQIKYLEVYEGKAMVEVGQTVNRGDLIVSGIMEDQYGKKQFKYARARVIAQTYEQNTARVSLKQPVWEQSGRSSERYLIKINGRLLPVWGAVPKTACMVSEQYSSGAVFDVMRREYTPVKLTTRTLTPLEAKEQAMKCLEQNQKSEQQQVISCEREGSIQNGIYVLTERRLVEKDIAETSEIDWQRETGLTVDSKNLPFHD